MIGMEQAGNDLRGPASICRHTFVSVLESQRPLFPPRRVTIQNFDKSQLQEVNRTTEIVSSLVCYELFEKNMSRRAPGALWSSCGSWTARKEGFTAFLKIHIPLWHSRLCLLWLSFSSYQPYLPVFVQPHKLAVSRVWQYPTSCAWSRSLFCFTHQNLL